MFDIHTHNKLLIHNPNAIVNCNADDDFSPHPLFSLGFHPWDVDAMWEGGFEKVEQSVLQIESKGLLSKLAAIGEIGLDKNRGGAMQAQMDCFRRMLGLADRYVKPVILHCVKAVDEILMILNEENFSLPVVFHGFRGKPEQARQLLNKGFYLSFGPKFNDESIKLAYEAKRMFLETDDSRVGIEDVYELAGKVLSISPTDISVPGIFTS